MQRGVDAGDQHAMSTQAERAGAARQDHLALLDKIEKERDWKAYQVDFGRLVQELRERLEVCQPEALTQICLYPMLALVVHERWQA